MELLNQMDGFDSLGKVKMIMATNRPDTLDPALLRPGRLDRKIEIPLPNEQNRLDVFQICLNILFLNNFLYSKILYYWFQVLKIHATKITKHGEIEYEAIVKLSEGFSGADLRNVCTEAGKGLDKIVFKLSIAFRIICYSSWKGICHNGGLYESGSKSSRCKEARNKTWL